MANSRRDIAIGLGLAVLTVLLLVDAARADVGVERVSRQSGRPGAEVTVTLGCGFCFPPCKGPKGMRHPQGFKNGPCMLDGGREPPASFGISLLPQRRADALLGCTATKDGCPEPLQPPGRHHFRFLGNALPPPSGNNPEGGNPPRYFLRFQIPPLPPGLYSYVIWCDACLDGPAGSLGVDPHAPVWGLQVR